MLVVEGIEKALVGWHEREGKVGAIYSVDRIHNLLEDDGLNPKERELIIGALKLQVEMTQADDEDIPPILVNTADYDEVVHREKTGDFTP
mgnify:FL=1|tara:strand:- start:3127 stop:3396 length:270 start_codon:yes stop_codon:yes gene_type:complete